MPELAHNVTDIARPRSCLMLGVGSAWNDAHVVPAVHKTSQNRISVSQDASQVVYSAHSWEPTAQPIAIAPVQQSCRAIP